MKKLIYIIISAVALLSVSVSADAAKKVWLLGHRCNSMKMIQMALEDGANGVEIDISYGKNKDGSDHWCVAHGKHVPLEKCDDSEWMALKTLLAKVNVETGNFKNFSLLFLDIKSQNKYKELVNYVHQYCPNPKFYIIYGLNLDKIYGGAISDDEIKWLRDNLNDHEGFCTQTDTNVKFIEGKLNALSYPWSQYCYVDGCCVGIFGKFQFVKEAGARRDAGKMCARTGYWTCQHVRTARRTYTDAHCDFTMTECRGWGASHAWRWTLKKTHKFLSDSKNGYEMATRSDKFFWK